MITLKLGEFSLKLLEWLFSYPFFWTWSLWLEPLFPAHPLLQCRLSNLWLNAVSENSPREDDEGDPRSRLENLSLKQNSKVSSITYFPGKFSSEIFLYCSFSFHSEKKEEKLGKVLQSIFLSPKMKISILSNFGLWSCHIALI